MMDVTVGNVRTGLSETMTTTGQDMTATTDMIVTTVTTALAGTVMDGTMGIVAIPTVDQAIAITMATGSRSRRLLLVQSSVARFVNPSPPTAIVTPAGALTDGDHTALTTILINQIVDHADNVFRLTADHLSGDAG
jgi:hypothetical protein